MKLKAFILFVGLVPLLNIFAQQKPLYLDSSANVELRAKDLLERMTLEEKIGQMCQYLSPGLAKKAKEELNGLNDLANDQLAFYPNLTPRQFFQMIEKGEIGSFLNLNSIKEANELQQWAAKSRLKIPLLISVDAIHGSGLYNGATVFPTPLTLSSSWDDNLLKEIARATAVEVRATGMHWTFSPNVDVARDPRWGRCGETFGEDPYLVTRMGVAMTDGYQNNPSDKKVLACAKHFIAGSEPSNGTNSSSMDVSQRQLREIWLPPFEAQVNAGVYTFMAAHNELNGVPCHGNKKLLTDVLRHEWNFQGFVVSDWMDIERLSSLHQVVANEKEAAVLAVNAGVDMHMHGPGFFNHILKGVEEGKISENQINKSCLPIITAKIMLGLFENPYVDTSKVAEILSNSEHRQLALDAARKSIVLLKNSNLLLPLKSSTRIMVTGPNANNQTILGDWTMRQPDENVTTIFEGMQQVFSEANVDFYDSSENIWAINENRIKELGKKASEYDAVIVVVGENSLRYQKTKTCGENVDRANINLLGKQLDLVKELYANNPKVIVVFVNGRPIAEPWISENIPAIIEAWEPGNEGGLALAEIIAGKVNPSGKLTMTIPYSVGQLVNTYNHKPSQFFHPYIDEPKEPLYPFGYGLSYTTFEYSNLNSDKAEYSKGDTLTVSVDISNTGNMDGEEIVQLYIRDEFSSVTRPVKELKQFKRIALKPNQTKTCELKLPASELAFYNLNMEYLVEPGDFQIMIGGSSLSSSLLSTIITIIE